VEGHHKPEGNRQNRDSPGIRIIEVGPRDGLQHESDIISTDAKVSFVNALSTSGVTEIEAGSFVSSRAIPQLADSDEVFRRIERRPGVIYSALVANERGLERARAAAVNKIAVFTAASDTFTRRNINCTIDESIVRFRPVVCSAKLNRMTVRGYVSTVTHCPFEGAVRPSQVLDVMRRLLDLGVDEISLGDTVGKASPRDIRRLLDVLVPRIERSRLSLHVHDTCGMAVANVLTAWTEYGIEAFDTSAGGLGGCPYAPGASGNVATEDVVYALKASGASLAVDERKIIAAASEIGKVLNRRLSSRLSQVQTEQTAYEGVA
jgi:hydroxymethylglutaryl-CoA lyase